LPFDFVPALLRALRAFTPLRAEDNYCCGSGVSVAVGICVAVDVGIEVGVAVAVAVDVGVAVGGSEVLVGKVGMTVTPGTGVSVGMFGTHSLWPE